MPVKVIVWLVVAVASVLMAVVVLVKLWNLFIGGNVTQDDAYALAKIIDDMIERDEVYLQVPFIARLEGNSIVGYDEDEAWAERPSACEGKACICSRKENDEIRDCRALKEDDQKVYLVSDYAFFSTPSLYSRRVVVPKSAGDSDLPTVQIYYPFVVSTELVEYWSTGRGGRAEATETNAILPLILEKQVIGDEIVITVLPDTDYARSRPFYVYTCPASSHEQCRDKTPYQSAGLAELTTIENYAGYCEVSILDGSCQPTRLPLCTDTTRATGASQLITAPCNCGGEAVSFGTCTWVADWKYIPLLCEGVRECNDYCIPSGEPNSGSDAGTSGAFSCDVNEYQLCGQDPCGVGCTGEATNGNFQCVSI